MAAQITPLEPGKDRRRRSVLPLAIFAVLSVIVPFLTWRQTWFGRSLSDREIGKYLDSRDRPRNIQHALSQIAEQLTRNVAPSPEWYPKIVALADHPEPAIRTTVAWVMGQDNKSETFHDVLRRLLRDPDLMVRRNAALSLVRFADAGGRSELRAMLEPHPATSPAAGILSSRLKAGDPIAENALIARITAPAGRETEVRSPMAGRINRWLAREGASVAVGDPLVAINPRSEQVWEALRGLYLVGQPEDLAAVELYTRPLPEMPGHIRQQASLTAQAIRSRSERIPSR
jgi:hypothetical protein